MIYTSYFGNIKKIPIDMATYSICGKSPDWYKGLEYKKLAPKYNFFKVWKETRDNDYYIECFNEQVLNKLDPFEVADELNDRVADIMVDIARVSGIVLLCYEKPPDFCHRHLVADWFNKNGIDCEEYRNE